jgi:hypothetical protein
MLVSAKRLYATGLMSDADLVIHERISPVPLGLFTG